MASSFQSSTVLQTLENLKRQYEEELAKSIEECLAKKKSSDAQRSGLQAQIGASERKIEQLQKLIAESDGSSDIVVDSDWLVHGVNGVIPLCVVECPDCDNAVIEGLEKTNLEKRVAESTEELAQSNDVINKLKDEIISRKEDLHDKAVEKNKVDKAVKQATDNITSLTKEVAELDAKVAQATKMRSAEKKTAEADVIALDAARAGLANNIKARTAKIEDAVRSFDDLAECKNFIIDVDGKPRIDVAAAEAAGADVCVTLGLQLQQWDADNENDQTTYAAAGAKEAEIKKQDAESQAAYDDFLSESAEQKKKKTEEIEADHAIKEKAKAHSDSILEEMDKLSDLIDKRKAELEAEDAFRQEIEDLIESLEKRISNIMSDCDECGTWRIILQGSDETSEGPDCLLGWDYSEDGDILIDEDRLANNIKFITLYHKPENLLVDKRGDVWADGVKIARVALTGLAGEFFDNFDDPRLARLMIKPRFIGDNRILHVMQEGFHVICENPNSLRDELARHDLLPYHVGTYFRNRAKECDDHETHDELEELCKVECCGPPELPDCFDIGDCPVTVPQWFKDWYAAHSENLYLKLPYDKRFDGDPLRYSREEQIKFSNAVVDLVIRYFNSTPMKVESGFDDWFVDRGMKRILNILPLIKKENPPRGRFNFAGWTFGTNSNSPELLLPLEIDSSTGEAIECVECCDLMDSSCAPMLSFDDCCEFACGRWSQDCSYEEGDIVIGKSGEACYEAMVDICAGDCNPEPGKAAETIWRKCTIDCEQDAPVCDFILSDQFICADKNCEPEVSVAALYALNQEQCEYHWTLTAINVYGATPDVTAESFGYAPGEVYDENNNIVVVDVPLLPVGCGEDDSSTQSYNPNTWIFRLDARATESNEILSTCFSQEKELDLDCGFSVELWDGLDEIRAAAYNWCDEAGGDNPNGKRQGAPETELGQRVVAMESQYELLLSHIDNPDARSTESDYYQITTAQTKIASVVSLLSTEYAVDTSTLETILENISVAVDANDFANGVKFVSDAVFLTVDTIKSNDIYVGVEDCCCIIVKPDENDQAVCDLSWVWLVRSNPTDLFIPYYGGVGTQAAASVLCVERNPDEYNTTHAEVRLVSYAASCDDIVKARIEGWDGTSSWDSSSDGFEANPVCQCYRTQSITCPCSPRDGVANVVPVQCDDQDATKYYVDLAHNNPFNECNVDWIWQLEDNTLGGSPTEIAAGQGVKADNKTGVEVLSGHDYTIKLRWMSVDGMTGGVVFEQSYTTPVCPRLDLTFDFNFTETQYGEITSAVVTNVNSMDPDNYIGVASGSSGPFITCEADDNRECLDDGTVNFDTNLYINTGDSNPYGTFKIAATHNPDLNDPHWQAVDKNAYLWKWIVRILDGDTVVAVLESAERTSENGKAPDLISEDLNADQISHTSNSYTYKVELVAIRNNVHEETNEVEKLNNLHKGARTINSIVPAISEASYNITLNGSAYNRTIEYIPQTNFHGTETEGYTVTYSYANGSTSSQSFVFTVNVVPDPCILNYAYPMGAEPINLPATIPAGETELLQEFRITTEFDLSNECGELSNPDTIFNFGAGYVSGTASDGQVIMTDVVFNEESRVVTDTGNGAKLEVVGTVTVPFDLTSLTDCSGGQSYNSYDSPALVNSDYMHDYSGQANTMAVASVTLSFGGSVTTSDHPDGGNLDPQQSGVTNHYLTLPYCRCWDGSLILRDSGTCPDKPGCMNPNATNYDWQATVDDGSCIVLGCTDPDALNYDDSATQDNGSCCYEPELASDVGGEIESQIQDDDNVTESGMVAGWRDNITSTVIGHAPSDPNIPVIKFTIPDGSFELDDAAAQSGQGTMLPGYATIQIDLEKLIANSDIQALKYSVTSGPNAKEACGYHYDYSFMGGENNVMNIRFGEQTWGRNKLNQTPSFNGTTCTFSAEASDCSVSIPPQWGDIGMESDLAANPNSVFYLIEARYDGSGYPCDEAVRKVVLEFTIAPQTFDAACRKQTPSDETPCSVDQTGAVHNPDLCCENVSVNDDIDSADLLNFSNAANLNGGYVTTDTSSGTHNGIDYDIKITIQDGAVNLDNDSGNHYIRMEMDELFSRASASTRIRYDWTASANARDGGSSGETGNWNDTGTTGFKVRVGNNLISSGNTYRSSVGSPTIDQGEETFPPTHPEVVYTLKATNLDCTPCTVETETVTILVVMEDQTRCVAPVVVDQSTRDSIAATMVASANTDSNDGPVIDVAKLQAVASGATGAPFKVGEDTVLVDTFGVWIKNEFITIPDSWVTSAQSGQQLTDGTGGVRFSAGMGSSGDFSGLFQEGTVGDNTTYDLTRYDWNGTEYVWDGADNVGSAADPVSMELGWHEGGSGIVSRIRGVIDGNNWKGYMSTGGTTNDTKNYKALLITASNPGCDEVARIAMYMRLDDQVRENVVGCTDDNATNTDSGALIDDGSCCYEVNHKNETTTKNNINAIIDDVGTTLTGMDKTNITAYVQGDGLYRIDLFDGAWDLPTSAGGIVTIPMDKLFDFPNSDTGSEANYVYSGTCTANSISDVTENFDNATLRTGGTPHFKIRLGQNGGNASYARHKLTDVTYSDITTVGNEERSTASWTAKNHTATDDVQYKIIVKLYDDNGNLCSEDFVRVRVRVLTQTFAAGCMDSNAFNYYPSAVVENPQISCQPVVQGCIDIAACNYDMNANTDDGTCLYRECCFTSTNLIAILDGWQYDGNTAYLLQPAPSVPVMDGWDDTTVTNPWRYTDKYHALTTLPEGYHAGFGQYHVMGTTYLGQACVKPTKADENRPGGAYRGLIMSKNDLDQDGQVGTNAGAIYDHLLNTCGLMAVIDGLPTTDNAGTTIPVADRTIQIGDVENGLNREWGWMFNQTDADGDGNPDGLRGTGEEWGNNDTKHEFIANQDTATDIGKAIMSCLILMAADLNTVKHPQTGQINCEWADEIINYWASTAYILGRKWVVPYNYHQFSNRITQAGWCDVVGISGWTLENVKNWFSAAKWSSHKIGQGCGTCDDENMGNLVGDVQTGGPYDTGPYGDWEISTESQMEEFLTKVGLHNNSVQASGAGTSALLAVASAYTTNGISSSQGATDATDAISSATQVNYNFSWLDDD